MESDIQVTVRRLRCIRPTATLCDRPLPGRPVDRERGPALTVLPRDVDQQRVLVVLHANPVPGIPFFFQAAHDSTTGSAADERGPANAPSFGPFKGLAAYIWHDCFLC